MRKTRYYLDRYLGPAACRFSVGRAIVQKARELIVKKNDADVFIISIAKSGRTWLRLILGKAFALHHGLRDVNLLKLKKMAASCPKIPLIEMSHDDHPGWKTPKELLTSKQEYQGKRVILLARDPRDILVSRYFARSRRLMIYKGDLSSFLRSKMGSIDTIISFYNIWAEARHVPAGFLLVRYEDMQADTGKEIRRMLDFLGLHEIGDDLIEEATEFARFDNMRRMEMSDAFGLKMLRPADKSDPESYKTRKGKVGGFLDYLSKEDIEYVNHKVSTQLSSFYGYPTNVGRSGDA